MQKDSASQHSAPRNSSTVTLPSKDKYKRKNKDLEDSKIAYKIVYSPESGAGMKELTEEEFFEDFLKKFPEVAGMLLNPDEKITKEMIEEAK